METWLKDKKEYVLSTDYGDSISGVQSKMRAHAAFEQQVKIHQPRVGELQEIVKEISTLLKSQCEEQDRLQVLVLLLR
jgi:spectrin alpha